MCRGLKDNPHCQSRSLHRGEPHPRDEQENPLEDRNTRTFTEVSITSKKLCFPDLKIGFTIRFVQSKYILKIMIGKNIEKIILFTRVQDQKSLDTRRKNTEVETKYSRKKKMITNSLPIISKLWFI